MTETETTTFPLHPVAEETLAAMPEVTARLTQAIEVPPYPLWRAGAQPWVPWDECVPVTKQACAALVAGWLDEARARLAAAPKWGTSRSAAPAPVPAENDGPESGHIDPSAASEGDAADVDLPRPDETTVMPVPEAPTEAFQAVPAVKERTKGRQR